MKTKEIILLVVATAIVTVIMILGIRLRNQSKQIEALKIEMAQQKLESILRLDSTSFALTEQMITSLKERDSLVAAEFKKLVQQQIKLNQKYEKLNADYSSIVIERPEF
jgi:hypothetical protein